MNARNLIVFVLALLISGTSACGSKGREPSASITPTPGAGAETAVASSTRLPATPKGTAPSESGSAEISTLGAEPGSANIATADQAYTYYSYEVLATYPHDPGAFTQGLIVAGDTFFEGTGLRGQSTLREVNIESGEILRGVRLPEQYFGEGITLFKGKIYQLTWQAQTGFIFDPETFEMLGTFTYPTEGWGITHDGEQLIMSDGSEYLSFLDPDTLQVTHKVAVLENNRPVLQLNELEYINGVVFANVWQTDRIVLINPESGMVVGSVNLQGIIDPTAYEAPINVLNGIAYDEATDRLFVTGKLWPVIFEINLVPQ